MKRELTVEVHVVGFLFRLPNAYVCVEKGGGGRYVGVSVHISSIVTMGKRVLIRCSFTY